MVVVPIPLIVTSPLVSSTVATPASLDLNVIVPSVFFVRVFVKGASSVVFCMLVLANFRVGAA